MQEIASDTMLHRGHTSDALGVGNSLLVRFPVDARHGEHKFFEILNTPLVTIKQIINGLDAAFALFPPL